MLHWMFDLPPDGVANTLLHTRHFTSVEAFPKIICSFLQFAHLTFMNFDVFSLLILSQVFLFLFLFFEHAFFCRLSIHISDLFSCLFFFRRAFLRLPAFLNIFRDFQILCLLLLLSALFLSREIADALNPELPFLKL